MSSAKRRRIAGEAKPALKPEQASKPRSRIVKPKALVKPTPPKESSERAPTSEAVTASKVQVAKTPSLQIVLAVIALAILLGGGFSGVRGLQSWQDRSSMDTARSAAERAAGQAAEKIFTYRFDQLTEYERSSKALMTPAFAEKFDTISPALNELAPQREIQLKATSRAAAAIDCVTKCSEDSVTVLVFLDQARLADGSKEPTVFGNRVTLTMSKRGEKWLVADVTAL